MKRQILLATIAVCLVSLSFTACARKHKTLAPQPAGAATYVPPIAAAAPERPAPAPQPIRTQPKRIEYVRK